jgi:hypothetical protein
MNYAGVLAGQKNESLMTCQQREDNLVNTGQKQIHLKGLFGIPACFLSYSLPRAQSGFHEVKVAKHNYTSLSHSCYNPT